MAIRWIGNELNEFRNDQLEDAAIEAHERRMARRNRFVESNPNAVSPQERAGIERWRYDQGLTGRERDLQRFEMDMLRQRGENDLQVAEQRRFGMKEQGADAAEFNAGASKYRTDAEAAWRQHEADMLKDVEGLKGRNALDLETRRGENALRLAERQGRIENDRFDSNEEIERIKGENAFKVEQQRAATAASLAEQEAQRRAAQDARKSRLTNAQRLAEARKLVDSRQAKSLEEALDMVDAAEERQSAGGGSRYRGGAL